MDLSQLAVHALALAFYPGAALVFVAGMVAELGLRRLSGGGSAFAVGGAKALRAAPLAALAATQLSVPFNPLSPAERSVLVAALAVVGAAWLAAESWPDGERARRAFLPQACWLLALLAPALAAGTLRPAALASVAVLAQLPLKVSSALLFALCLPAFLTTLPSGGRHAPAGIRSLFWWPCCGLGASVYLPPASEDVLGLLRFGAEVAALAGLAAGLWVLLRRRPALGRLQRRAMVGLALFTVACALGANLVG